MSDNLRALIIPAHNEERSIGDVLETLPRDLFSQIIVVNNASTDRTPDIARAHGVIVVDEPRKGYGQACLTGIQAIEAASIVVFMDADASDDPNDIQRLLRPLEQHRADLVIGSRVRGHVERGAMTVPQVIGNRLATSLIRLLWGYRYTDLGPFRAITREALERLGMRDTRCGWTVEMQIRALEHGLRVAEVPATYRQRIGDSKISGTVRGVVCAGWDILSTVFRLRISSLVRRSKKRLQPASENPQGSSL